VRFNFRLIEEDRRSAGGDEEDRFVLVIRVGSGVCGQLHTKAMRGASKSSLSPNFDPNFHFLRTSSQA